MLFIYIYIYVDYVYIYLFLSVYRAKHPDGVMEGIIGANDADTKTNMRLAMVKRHIRGSPVAEKPKISEVKTKFDQFSNDRKQHQAKLLQGEIVNALYKCYCVD